MLPVMNVEFARSEESPLQGHVGFLEKHLLHVAVTGFLIAAFACCLLLTTGGLRQIVF